MRKTSHDGLDSTSVTSGLENEIKKVGQGLLKSKKNSIKRKVPNFSHESDDGIIEPLLQTDKDKTDIANRSAKYMLSKTKTDSISEVEDLNIVSEHVAILSAPTPISTTNKVPLNNIRDYPTCTKNIFVATSIENQKALREEDTKVSDTNKNSILVELDGSKKNYNPSPLIFTTAKIHADSKTTKPMELVPILSTIERSDKSEDGSNVSGNKTIKSNLFNQQSFSIIPKESTSNEILSLKNISKYSESGYKNIANNIVGNKSDLNHFIKTDAKLMKNASEKYTSKEIEDENNSTDVFRSSGSLEVNEKKSLQTIRGSNEKGLEGNTELDSEKVIKKELVSPELKSYEQSDKQFSTLSKSNSKKLQRQKKTTHDDVNNSDGMVKDKITGDKPMNVNDTSSIPLKDIVPARSLQSTIISTISSNPSHVTTCSGITSLQSNKLMSPNSTHPSKVYSPQIKSSLNTTNMPPIVTSTISKISTELKSDTNNTTSSTLPPYIVPTSKTKIGGAHISGTNNSVIKTEKSVSVSSPIITTVPRESPIITTNTSNIISRDVVTTTTRAAMTRDTDIKTTSSVISPGTFTKSCNTGMLSDAVTKTTSTVRPHETVNKTTSIPVAHQVTSKTASNVKSPEVNRKTTSSSKPREGVTKTASNAVSREPTTKTSTSVTPREVVSKTTTIITPREITPKSTSTTSPREVASKIASTATSSKAASAVTSRELVNKTSVISREPVKKTPSTLTREMTSKTSSSTIPREAVTKTTSPVTVCDSTVKTTNIVTPHKAVAKTTSTVIPAGMNINTTSSIPREVPSKSTSSRETAPASGSDSKSTKSTSSSNDITKSSTNSKQSQSKNGTHSEDRRA